jgi:chemotaxis receptor (MCP) glutamine deamidase CheD
LRQQRIDVIEENLGGNQGRKVIFFTDTGETHMRLIGQ